jgi:hypothetical protein
MKCTTVFGDIEVMDEIKGSSFVLDRPVKMRVEGKPWARDKAVSAPMEFGEGPVRRTVDVRF